MMIDDSLLGEEQSKGLMMKIQRKMKMKSATKIRKEEEDRCEEREKKKNRVMQIRRGSSNQTRGREIRIKIRKEKDEKE